MIVIFVDIEPSPAARPRTNFKTGAIYNTPKYRDYLRTLAIEFRRVMKTEKPLDGPLWLDIIFCMPLPKKQVRDYPTCKPDLSNLIKAVEDAGNKILWNDDSQIVELSARKIYDSKTDRGGIYLNVYKLPEL